MKFTQILFKNVTTPVSSYIKELRQASLLPQYLHEVAIGQILADAGCFGSSPTSNSRMEWSFGHQREVYATYIAGLFADYIGTGLSTRMVNAVKGGPKEYISFRLKTLSLPVFNYYRHLFYVLDSATGKYIKTIPTNIIDMLTPVVLAQLVMGDGNFQPDANTLRIYTNGFTLSGVQLLAQAIESKYGIYVGVRHDRKGQYILAIGARDIQKFRDLVAPHVHNTFLYRLGM